MLELRAIEVDSQYALVISRDASPRQRYVCWRYTSMACVSLFPSAKAKMGWEDFANLHALALDGARKLVAVGKFLDTCISSTQIEYHP